MTDPVAIAEMAMLNDVSRLNVISQNLANANTAGYKRDIPVTHAFSAVFDKLAPQIGSGAYGNVGSPGNTRTVTDTTQGVSKNTGNKLDLLIEGKGYFEVTTPEGTAYTRAGSFSLDARGRLVTPEGWPVSTVEGDLRLHGTDPVIDREGYIWEGDTLAGQLRIVEFGKGVQFEKMGGKLLRPVGKVEVTESEVPAVRQGYVETSNVDAAQEMVRMMETVRHFESAQRVITGYDDMLGTAIDTIGEF